MANVGNAWHIPTNPEPRGWGGMRGPVGAIVPGTAVSILSGNQFQGDGNAGNQLGDGSSVLWRRAAGLVWTDAPMVFERTFGNNKYFRGTIASDDIDVGDVVEYYLRVPYDDHDTSFVYAVGDVSAVTADETIAQASPFSFTVESAAVRGRWAAVVDLPNVPIHAHLLPNDLVLLWGRRDHADQTLDEHSCTPFLWNWRTGQATPTPQPMSADGTTTVNLFCAGHSFLPDGRLLVAGGHWADGDGLAEASLYDPATNTWSALPPMTTPAGQAVRRWYPTCTTLADGGVLVLSGSYLDPTRPAGAQVQVVDLLQVWRQDRWVAIDTPGGAPLNYIGLPLYPRMHVVASGEVFMSGTMDRTSMLTATTPGAWTFVGFRELGNRDYCPAVMFADDRLIYIGGGGGAGGPPTAAVEMIDLAAPAPQWQEAAAMRFPRRQHNATVLPDGSVLVTGGTRGAGFNNLDAGQPVHVAELWDPATQTWQEMAAESVDRCYHSTAMLLPDGTVLSGGGGEFRTDGIDNDPADSHRNAQIFSPPYLFKGARPTITAAPATVPYNVAFDVVTSAPATIGKVVLISLASVTHSFDENQHVSFLPFTAAADRLTVSAPTTPGSCPPGHYMLFVVTAEGVPSAASIVQVQPAFVPAAPASPRPRAAPPLTDGLVGPADLIRARTAPAPLVGEGAYLPVHAYEADVEAMPKGTAVVVGITGSCPYGIGACWGGAYEALGRLDGVEVVRPVPNNDDSTAEVFLRNGALPNLRRWAEEFARILNGTYVLRGVEVTLDGRLEVDGMAAALAATADRPAVALVPLGPADKIQWDLTTSAPKHLEWDEATAYARLTDHSAVAGNEVVVTGPLLQTATGYELKVRRFDALG